MIPLSFEFFPPKTKEGEKKLITVANTLAQLNPEFFSVTFGANGSTKQGTFTTVQAIHQQTSLTVVPHISCLSSTPEALSTMLAQYQAEGIQRLVVLRGDSPEEACDLGELSYASQLVEFIRTHTGGYFQIDVAAYPEMHPQASDAQTDFQHFVNKVKAGANGAITQYFYNADAYFYFLEKCERAGIDVPIVPGIMPITNAERLIRFSARCQAEIPRWIVQQLLAYGDDVESIKQFGIEVVTQLCEKLCRGGAPGLHFYTLNGAQASVKVCKSLKAL